ncbi:MAG: STT3 domain-containing protein, partial [Patescibacteria group bacterium]|nr:STT3 domain-containing protein [Patescibacteria group bacterium]
MKIKNKIKNFIYNLWEKIAKNEKIISWFLLFIIVAFSLFLRIYFPWQNVFTEPIKYAADDGVYHMRLVENMLLGGHFPHRLYYDAYTYFPYGTYIHFAPLYDWLLSAVIWVISFGNPTLILIDKIAPFYPAILGGLAVLVVYFIGKTLWDKWVGLFSAFLMSISQPFLFRSLLGATDHHQAEVLFSNLAVLFLILAFKSEKNLRKKQFWIYSVLAGVALGLYFLAWTGALIFLFIFFVSIIIYYLVEYYLGYSRNWILVLGSVVFLITLLMIIPFSGHPDLLHSPLYNINHLGSLFLGLLAFFVLYIIGKFVKKYELQFWYFP